MAITAATAAAGIGFAFAIRRLPRLSLQLASLAVVAVVLPLASVTVSGIVMLRTHEALEVLALASVAAVVASVGALLIARGITRPVQRLHDAALRIGAGDLSTRLDPGGPTELGELATAFNSMATSVQRTFDARSEFIAWASHDLRSPVASLQAMIEAINDRVTPPERYLPAISERISDLARLVEDLFDLARADLERVESTATTDAVALTRRAVTTHQPAAAGRRVTIALHTDLPTLPVRCAASDLARILDNVLDNTVRHTPAGGHITVALDRDGTLTITDTGPGFPPDCLDRAFEPFWRADLSRHTTGAGLGLAIARALIQRNGGTITASNAPGAQLTITCQPALTESVVAPALRRKP